MSVRRANEKVGEKPEPLSESLANERLLEKRLAA